jgi:hypothetical protein
MRSKLTKQYLIQHIEKYPNHNIDLDAIPDDLKLENRNGKVKLLCKLHGEFLINFSSLNKRITTCPLCLKEQGKRGRKTYDLNFVKELAISKGGVCLSNKYYGLRNMHKFRCANNTIFYTSPDMIMRKDRNVWCDCVLCKPDRRISKGEDIIQKFLDSHDIKYIGEKRFSDLKSDLNHAIPFDFYLPEYKVLIEYDGAHHFVPVNYYGGEKVMKRIQSNDLLKNKYVLDSPDLHMIRVPYSKKMQLETLLSSYIFNSERDKVLIVPLM